MGVPLLLGSNSNTLSAAERFSATVRGLRLLGWTGLIAVVLGVSDLLFAATMLPPSGSGGAGGFVGVATAFGNLVLLGAGACALTISAVGLNAGWYRRAVGVLCALLTCGLLAILILWTGSAMDALRADLPVVQHANARAVARVLFTAVGFGTLFVVLAVTCLHQPAPGARAPVA